MAECINCGATDDREHGIVVGLYGELNEAVCNVCRTEAWKNAGMTPSEARVWALKEQGYTHPEIAEIVQALQNANSPKKGTVDKLSSDAKEHIEESRRAVQLAAE